MKLYESVETNAYDAYVRLSNIYGWDKDKANCFLGKGTRLHASFADKTRKRGIWFIAYSNLSNYQPDFPLNWTNGIEGKDNETLHLYYLANGKKLRKDIEGFTGENTNADDRCERIVFVKDGTDTYRFYGVYAIHDEPSINHRIYKRIADEI